MTPRPTGYDYVLEWPFWGQRGFGLTPSALVSDVSDLAGTNEVWPPLWPVSVVQKNKPSTMLSLNVQSINIPMDCTAWRFWMIRQLNGCSTPDTRSAVVQPSSALKEKAQIMKKNIQHKCWPWSSVSQCRIVCVTVYWYEVWVTREKGLSSSNVIKLWWLNKSVYWWALNVSQAKQNAA